MEPRAHLSRGDTVTFGGTELSWTLQLVLGQWSGSGPTSSNPQGKLFLRAGAWARGWIQVSHPGKARLTPPVLPCPETQRPELQARPDAPGVPALGRLGQEDSRSALLQEETIYKQTNKQTTTIVIDDL